MLGIEGPHICIAKNDCRVGAKRKKQATVLETEGENGYIKMKDKELPTSHM